MEELKKKRSVLCFDIPLDIKAHAKAAAAMRHMSLSRWIVKCIRKELRATMENPTRVCECFKDKE
jgi:hypothetical protein